jgi:hypothetical protein
MLIYATLIITFTTNVANVTCSKLGEPLVYKI